jgi:F-type H+-transporting ATPase subunit delta
MTSKVVARRYAKALVKLGDDMQVIEKWVEDLKFLLEIFDLDNAARILKSPIMPASIKLDILFFGLSKRGMDKTIESFIRLLVEKGRICLLAEIAEALEILLFELQGKLKARITTAYPLDSDEKLELSDVLRNKLGKEIKLENIVDNTILGGFLLKVGHFSIDSTLNSRIGQLVT